MSSGSRVRREGTIAMSSKPYARRPFLPRPISISIVESSQSAADEKTPRSAGPNGVIRRAARALFGGGGQVV